MTASGDGPGIFSTVAGLPLHPLVVHVAVVLLPLSAVALCAVVAVPRWRARYGPLAVIAAIVGAGGAVIAKQSGESLAGNVGRPVDHAAWGDRLVVVAVGYAVVAAVWWVLERRTGGQRAVAAGASTGASAPARLLGGVAAVLALTTLVLTVVVGHSGATAVWGDVGLAAPSEQPAPSDQPASAEDPSGETPTAGASTDSGTAVHSLAEVAQHTSDSSCWAAIEGEVYDLTSWIRQHPGGADRILALCGTDATAAFRGEHEDDRRPHEELARFKVGDLG